MVVRAEQLLNILCLRRCLVAEDAARDLCQSVYNLRYLLAKDVRDILYGIIGVLHYIVQECGADTCRAESHLLYGDASHGDRVHDIWFARQPAHTFVRLSGEVERLCYYVYLLPVSTLPAAAPIWRLCISVRELTKASAIR